MTHWYDFATLAPSPGVTVRLRRFPEDTPNYFGTFDFSSGIASSAVAPGLVITTPWTSLTHWSLLHGDPPLWPLAPSASSRWRDPFWTPPADGQFVWLKRWGLDCASMPAQWVLATQSFAITGATWQLPWHLVWRWKPRSTP